MSNRIEDLSPAARELHDAFEKKLKEGGVKTVTVSTLRTLAEQQALYAQGRLSLGEINALRVKAGMPLCHPDEASQIVTYADGIPTKDGGHGLSNHQSGNAFDKTFADDHGNPIYPTDPVRWRSLGAIGKSVGLEWGGDWPPLDKKTGLGFDVDHWQVPNA